jgi:hypothetical protein
VTCQTTALGRAMLTIDSLQKVRHLRSISRQSCSLKAGSACERRRV